MQRGDVDKPIIVVSPQPWQSLPLTLTLKSIKNLIVMYILLYIDNRFIVLDGEYMSN